MDDDFAGDVSTDGRYQIGESPLLARSDFLNDPDWFLVSGFRKFFDYKISIFLPPADLPSTFGSIRAGIYDANGDPLYEDFRPFRVEHDYTHVQNSGDRFLGIAPQREGYYRSQVLVADITGDTRETSRGFQPNFGQFHAGSITSANDADMFNFFLREGTTYQFELLGNSSNAGRDTTLGDPSLRLLDGETLIASDDNSGEGTNARISFTPTETGTYYLDVQGNGTQGTYLLGIPNVDDFIGSPAATARMQLEQQTSGRSDWFTDEDWFRFNVDAGFTYFLTNGSGLERVRLYELDGTLIDSPAQQFRAETTRDIFISVEGRAEEWTLTPFLRDDYQGTTFAGATRFNPGTILGAIEDSEDFDLFRFELGRNAFYDFRLDSFGSRPLEDAQLITYDSEGNLLERFEAGSTVRLRNLGFDTDPQFVLVHSPGENIGAWQLSQTRIDVTPGDISTDWNVVFNGGRGIIRNAIDAVGDVDFHRVTLRANSWYEIGGGGADLSIRRPGGGEVGFEELVNNFQNRYFYATETGDHFIVARHAASSSSDSTNAFAVSIRQNAAFNPIQQTAIANFTPDLNLASRFQGLSLEVWSEVPLQSGDQFIAPETLTELSSEQAAELTLADSLDRSGEVYIRGIFENGLKQDWSNWNVIHFADQPTIESTNRDTRFEYRFADTLPDEYAGDPAFSDFAPLTDDEQSLFNLAVGRWNQLEGVELEQRFDAQEMTVFKADLGPDQPLLAFGPATGRGYDIVLNSTSTLFQSETPESIFQLLQGIGTSIGFETSDSIDRHVSVLGTRVREGFEDVYPVSPLLADRLAVNPGRQFFGGDEFIVSTPIRLNGDQPMVRGIFAEEFDGFRSNGDLERFSITATGLQDAVSIDLRAGFKSVTLEGVLSEITNGPETLQKDGLGGFGDDRLTGNEGTNRLSGFGGNDVIRGGAGNDRLEGGRGDDFYIFRPGSDQDIISESGPANEDFSVPSGGLDVIRIEGLPDYDSIQEDFTFTRLGNDLVIRLELGGNFNVNGDSIRITNMDDPEKRVEALSLLNPDGFVERISMASVFEQADASRRRFEVLTARDDFGSLVQPV